MLSIILLLLKLIGIILAFIVLLLVLVIILVLFVPIRYNIYANYKEDINGEFKVHWLLHFLQFKGVYSDEKLRMKLRILGLVFYDSDKVKNTKEDDDHETKENKKSIKDKRHKKYKKDKIYKENIKNDINPKDNIGPKDNISPKDIINSKGNINTKDNISSKENEINKEVTLKKNVIDDISVKNVQKELLNEKVLIKKDNINENNLLKEVQNKDAENFIKNNADNINLIEDTHKENANNKENAFFAKIKSILRKIGSVILKIYNIPQKVKALFSKIGQIFKQLKDKLLNIKKIIDRIKNAIEKIKLFLQDEVNKDGMKHIFKGLKRILRHIKPKKITGEIEFGTKDPYETGQILAIISMGYGLYAKNFKIYPNFEEEILIGNVKVIGRIRLITLVIIGVKLILYKNNRQLVKNIMVLKEEL